MYNVGDTVQIAARKFGHRFAIGEVVKISKVLAAGNYTAYAANGYQWSFNEEECTPFNVYTNRNTARFILEDED